MKNLTFSIFILSMLSTGGFAQKQTYVRNIDVHVMPIALAFPDPSLRVGAEYMTAGRWSYGLSLGLGLAKTNVRYTRVQNPQEVSYDPFFEGENFFPGRKWTPLVSFGAKFGLLVWQKQD